MKKITALAISGITASFLLTGCGSTQAASQNSTPSAASASPEVKESSAPVTVSAGDTVRFGHYQGEDIDWYVLSSEDGKLLLLSVQALDSRPFDDNAATWDESELRAWLNDSFYNEAFTAKEQQAIQLVTLSNGDDAGYGTRSGKSTQDHVFLLSVSEADKYLKGNETVTEPDAYALSQGAYTNDDGNCAWWLRSPGMNDDGPAYYSSQGEIGTRAHKGSESIIGVRPAIWVSADAVNL